ncbi:MAG: hypothetical protein IH984_07425 [Planctomycetes bacterium]|nr:hypothetical protein [Planctomycetota bacterium]
MEQGNNRDSPILTSEEAVIFLRLDSDYVDIGDAVAALHRIARSGKIRPIKGLGKKHKWLLGELLRYSENEGLTGYSGDVA